MHDYDNTMKDDKKASDINDKIDKLGDIVENTKNISEGKNSFPYKYYTDTKSVHKIIYKKSKDGEMERKKFIIVGQNNFIIDSDDMKKSIS